MSKSLGSGGGECPSVDADGRPCIQMRGHENVGLLHHYGPPTTIDAEEKIEREREALIRDTQKRFGDWTVDPKTGRSNSSAEFERLAAAVGQLIRNAAHDLVAGRSDMVGGLIVAQLAHKHGMWPLECIRAWAGLGDRLGLLEKTMREQMRIFEAAGVPPEPPKRKLYSVDDLKKTQELLLGQGNAGAPSPEPLKREPYTPPAVADGGEACLHCMAPTEPHAR